MKIWLYFAIIIIVKVVNTHAAMFEITESLPNLPTIRYENYLNAWKIVFDSNSFPLMSIAQFCNSTCEMSTKTSDLMTCSKLKLMLSSGNWSLHNLQFNDNDCLSVLPSLPASPESFQEAFNKVYMPIKNTAWLADPETLIIKNNVDTLQQNINLHFTNNVSFVFNIRLAFLTPVHGKNLLAVMHNTYTLQLQQLVNFDNAIVGVEHLCNARNLMSPALSSLKLFNSASQLQVCVWHCRDGYMRQPWNSAPPLKTEWNSDQQKCQALPQQFTAVLFKFDIELPFTQAEALTADQLNILDTVMLSFKNTNNSVASAQISNSIFADAKFQDIVLQAATLHPNNQLQIHRLNQKSHDRTLLFQAQHYFEVEAVLIESYHHFPSLSILQHVQLAFNKITLPSTVLDIDNLRFDRVIQSFVPTQTSTKQSSPSSSQNSFPWQLVIVVVVLSSGIITIGLSRLHLV